MKKLAKAILLVLLLLALLVPSLPVAADSPIEIVSLRTENSKTYDLDNGGYRVEISSGIIHYKNNYTDSLEQWKDIDLTIRDNRLTTVPYELTIEGNRVTFRDKKTGEVSTLELLSVKPAGLKFEIIPFNEGISFQHTLPVDRVPFEAKFRVIGKGNLTTKAFDDAGELDLETSFVGNILTERLSAIKDKDTGLKRAAVGRIRIDPTLTVQPSAKDNSIYKGSATANYGDETKIQIYDHGNWRYRAISEFDISSLPAEATLSSASLRFYYYEYATSDPVGKTVWQYKITRTDWVEMEATWNIYKTDSDWTTAGGDYVTANPDGGSVTMPSSYGWVSWDVFAIVQDAYDNSNPAEFLVMYEEETAVPYSMARFYSKDYVDNTSLRPKLIIDYSILSPPTVTNSAADEITTVGADLHGEITDDGGDPAITTIGFEWDTDSGAPYANDWNAAYGIDIFEHTFIDMPSDDTIYWRAYATNGVGTGYSAELNFDTLLPLPSAPTDFTITQTGTNDITITWATGAYADTTIIRAKEDGYPTSITDGYEIYDGALETVDDSGLNLGTSTYFYRAWSENVSGYSTDYAEENIGGDNMVFLGILGFAAIMSFIAFRSAFFGLKLMAGMVWFPLVFLYVQANPPAGVTEGSGLHIALMVVSVGFGIMVVLAGLGKGIQKTTRNEDWRGSFSASSEGFSLKLPDFFKDPNEVNRRKRQQSTNDYNERFYNALHPHKRR